MTTPPPATDTLTRQEALDRATKVSGCTYQVTLDFTGAGPSGPTEGETPDGTFTSETVLRFSAPLVGLATFVDLDAEHVREITFNGRQVDPTTYDPVARRIPLRGLLANNELRVVADCPYQHTGTGLHRVVDPLDGMVYVFTQFEPFAAHRVFACFDQPDLKGTFSINVTAPDDWVVVSNSPVSERDGATWRFSPTLSLSTYLAAVVAGPFHAVRDGHGPIELGVYCRESLARHLDAEEILAVTRQGLDFFTEEFDYPYPFEKYDQLFVPEFRFGAMENAGCVTFSERMIFRSRVPDSARESRANVILHEMAHMWFGDLVTMRWWDDLWLNESFATYMATEASSRATRFTSAWSRFASGEKLAAARQDQLPTTHPISADIVDTDQLEQHFDGITYAKGASVLKQLVAWVGADAFNQGLRTYFPRHEWANAELSDFLGVLESTSGRDLGAWSKEWLETAGVNTLRASFETEESGYNAFAVLQEAPPDHPTLRSHRLALGIYQLTDDGLVRVDRVELDVSGPRTEVPALIGRSQPDLLLVNDDDLTYAKVRLDRRSLATLHGHLSRLADPVARSVCWAATADMVRDAELPTRTLVELVIEHAASEPDDYVMERLLGQTVSAVDVYGDPGHRRAVRAAPAARSRAELDRAEPGSDRQLVWARHWLSTIDEEAELSFARALLEGSAEILGLSVDTDLRWQIVSVLSAIGADDGRLIEEEALRDPSDIGRRRAAAARASRPTPEAKDEAWKLLMAGGENLAMQRAVASSFFQWEQDELLRPYVDRYHASLKRLWEERPFEEALALAVDLFPHTLVEEEVVARTARAPQEDDLPSPLHRVLIEGRDGLERALKARAADRQ